MGNEHQNRKDIDNLYDEIHDANDGSLNVVKFRDEDTLRNLLDDYSIENILDFYGVPTAVQKMELLDMVYPIGAIYMSINNVDPSVLFGGTWVQLKDRFLLGAGDSYTNGDTGGSKDAIVVEHNHKPYGNSNFVETTVGVSVDDTKRVASTSSSGSYYWESSGTGTTDAHSVTADEGNDGTNANMPPYLVVYMWKRTE